MFNQYLYNLVNINRYLTDAENQFYKASVVSVKYWFVSVVFIYLFIYLFHEYFTRIATSTKMLLLMQVLEKKKIQIQNIKYKKRKEKKKKNTKYKTYWLNIGLLTFLP